MVQTKAEGTGKKDSHSVKVSTRTTPHAHDVLCGRGGQSNNHPGNEWFRRLVRSNRALYRSCPKHTKLLVAKAIVQAVQQQDPQGRFIKLKGDSDSNESVWESISYTQAVNKTSQALREKESRDSRNRKKPQERQKQNEKKKLEIANGAGNQVHKDETKIENMANLTSATRNSAKESSKPNPLENIEMVQGPKQTGMSITGDHQQGSTQEIPRPLAQKRKISDTSATSQWNSGSTQSAMATALGTNATPGINVNFTNENGKKRMKTLDGVGGNIDTDRTGANEINNMGVGVVKQIPVDTSMPFPPETSLLSRQSTLFRFLNGTGIFGREAAVTQAQPTGLTNLQGPGMLHNSSQSTSWTQPTATTLLNNQAFRQDQRSSNLPFSSDQSMGVTSVQQLRSQQLQGQQTFLSPSFGKKKQVMGSAGGLQEEMEEMPTSGLTMRNDGGQHDATPPPPGKGLRTQMSDWLSSFFPQSKRDEQRDNGDHADNSNFDSSSHSDIDNDGMAVPPPPGGGKGLGRGVSSAIFGLVESPSLLLSTLKSGVSSVFGESATGESSSPSMRRFASAFQQQQIRQQLQQQNFPQQSSGNHPVLGESSGRRDSLLDDIDETPMEKELRNAKPEEKATVVGVRSLFVKPARNKSDYMSFK